MPSRPGRFSGARARQRALALCLLLPPLLPAAGRAEGWSLGLGYPSVSVKYDLKAVAFEGKYISGSGVQACAGRGYWNFYRVAGLNGFAGLEAGASEFLYKPFNPQELISKVEELLNRSSSASDTTHKSRKK